MEYDSETGNYYDMARYYSPRLGRFMSPDPADLAAVNPANPQSWNRYTYALNNPTSLTDPSGLDGHACGTGLICTTVTVYQFDTSSCSWLDASNCTEQELAALWGASGSSQDLFDSTFSVSCGPQGNCEWTYNPNATVSAPAGPGQGGGSGVTSGGASAKPQSQGKKGLFACASDAAQNVSIAADLHHISWLKSGVGGFVTNALAGNPLSGVTDLLSSLDTGHSGGHNVFYNMALGAMAGPSQGFSSVLPKAAEGTPWAVSPGDLVLGGLLGEYATGVGEANLTFSFITYTISFAGCGVGAIQ